MNRIELLQSYLAKTPDDSFLRHALALEYIKEGNDLRAVQLFDELLAHDPDYLGSYYHLGGALERIGNRDRALKIYEKGLQVALETKADRAYRELRQAMDELTDC